MIDTWFPTSIYYSDDNLVDELISYKDTCHDIMLKTYHDPHPFGESRLDTTFWHEEYGHLYKNTQFNSIKEMILSHAVCFAESLGYGLLDKKDFLFTNLWINFISENDYHALHTHNTIGRAALSGVFYIDAPEGSFLEIGSPYRDYYEPVKAPQANLLNLDLVKYDCKPGRLIMFKSSVFHGYNAHKKNYLKISIPFNLAIEKK